MFRRLIEKIINLLDRLAEALINLLKVESDASRSQIVRWILVSLTTMAVVVILAVVFLLSLFLAGMVEINAKLHLLGDYIIAATTVLVTLASSAWGAVKLWRKYFPSKEKRQPREFLPEGHYRMAFGDEDMDRKVLRDVIITFLEGLGNEVHVTGIGERTKFDRCGQVFAILRDTQDEKPLQIHVTLMLSKVDKNKLLKIVSARIVPKRAAGNVIFTMVQRGDLRIFQPWLKKAYEQANQD